MLHIKVAESLAKSADRTASERLWQTENGKYLFDFLTELLKEMPSESDFYKFKQFLAEKHLEKGKINLNKLFGVT